MRTDDASQAQASDGQTLVYVGAYTGFGPNKRGSAEGVDAFRMDRVTGALTHVSTLGGVENPSYLALHPTRRYLYAVNGSPSLDGEPGGGVTALEIDRVGGGLRHVNRQRTVGQGPCHATVDRSGRFVFAACYHTGTVWVFPTRPDGGLDPACDVVQHHGSSVHPVRQTSPHPHSVGLDLNERFALVPDLGLDRVFVYRLDLDSGRLLPHDPPSVAADPGVGPRHIAFHPSGRFVFVANEIGSSLSSYRYFGDEGRLVLLETLPTAPADFVGVPFTPDIQVGEAAKQPPVVGSNFAADVHVAPSGRFVYASNRGHDSIAIFAFDEAAERLTPLGHEGSGGRVPRGFSLDSSGRFLLAANQGSNSVVVFRVDAESGVLSPTGIVAATPTPTCVRIVDL